MVPIRASLCLYLLLPACSDPATGTTEPESSSSGASDSTGAPTTGTSATTEADDDTLTPTTDGTTAAPPAVCGDGIVQGDEPCDDASNEPLDGCDSKCKRTAHVLWTQTWDGGNKKDDYTEAVATDAAGNIYVVGSLQDADGHADMVLRKLDPAGEELLEITHAGALGLFDSASGVAIGTDGSIYVTGSDQIDAEPAYQGWLRKYDPAGKELWAYEHVSQVMGADTSVSNVAVDGDIVYMTGAEPIDADTRQAFLMRLDDGEPAWSISVEDPNSGRVDVTVTSTGQPVIALGVVDGVSFPWVGAFSPDGDELWSRSYLEDNGGFVNSIAVTPDDEFLLAGQAAVAGNWDFWVARLDANGVETWSDLYNKDYELDLAAAIAPAADGGFHVSGALTVTNQQQNVFVRQYAADNSLLWTDTYNDDNDLADFAKGIAVGKDQVIVVGSAFVLTNGQNHWVRAYAP